MLTPAVARAITSPSGTLLAGAAASAAILAGAGLGVAAAVGALVWAGRVALVIPRRKRRDINPALIREPWRSLVREAMEAEQRFGRSVADTDPGPIRDRLAEVQARVGVGVEEAWRIARRGAALERAVAELEVDGIEARLAQVESELRDGSPGGQRTARGREQLEATAESLRHQLESAHRLRSVAADARDRLRRLGAQLNEAVARAVELSLSADDVGAFQPLGSDVESLVGELESLRLALDETSRPA